MLLETPVVVRKYYYEGFMPKGTSATGGFMLPHVGDLVVVVVVVVVVVA